MSADVRLIAFYLPQFHPIPENDKWWGPGFTEWTNVTRGRPLYKEHYQPRRPGELGYYDLRVKDVRHRQIELARKYGIHGFCYYYYWFSGRRLLERPLELMLADSEIDFPFCVCWANENWSRRWDGSEHDILIEQEYAREDPARLIRELLPVLRDPRYITVNGAPILLVYRPDIIPDLRDVLNTWRCTAEELGVPQLHLCGVQSFGYRNGFEDGFDAMVEFPPHNIEVDEGTAKTAGVVSGFKGKIYSYADVVRYSVRLGSGVRLPVYRGLMTGWDNTARRGLNGHVFHGASPDRYEVWLRRLVDYTRKHHIGDQRLIFINAWNEWAEGAYLEPDEKYKHRFLEATARAVFGVPEPGVLIQTLRQISDGNDEALGILNQLDHAFKINERIIDLVEAKGLAGPTSSQNGFCSRFRHIEACGIKLPQTILANGVAGHLDALNTSNYHRGVTLNRGYDVFVKGWLASRRIRAAPNSPVVFQLTNLESGDRYVAQVPSRMRRDDVVSYVKSGIGRFSWKDAFLRYSGYQAYLNIAGVRPGSYKLEAIAADPDRDRGVMLILHSSILVL
jgi:hypothetical protein